MLLTLHLRSCPRCLPQHGYDEARFHPGFGVQSCRSAISITVLSYQWTCPGGSCDAAKVQQGNILVVNVRRHDDGGSYNCTVWDSSQQVGAESYLLTVAGELICIFSTQCECHY